MLSDETAFTLASSRLKHAKRCLLSAERELAVDTFDAYETAVNRSYYCVFHAMRAVLVLEKFESKKHSGVIARFRQNYIKTGIFSSDFSDIVGKSFIVRNDSDYGDMYTISRDDVVTQIEEAKRFLTAVEEYVIPKLPAQIGD
ncbi:hypothetical protein R80B4_01140 [Fibrobacteres bacterium R8-0-B4]